MEWGPHGTSRKQKCKLVEEVSTNYKLHSWSHKLSTIETAGAHLTSFCSYLMIGTTPYSLSFFVTYQSTIFELLPTQHCSPSLTPPPYQSPSPSGIFNLSYGGSTRWIWVLMGFILMGVVGPKFFYFSFFFFFF